MLTYRVAISMKITVTAITYFSSTISTITTANRQRILRIQNNSFCDNELTPFIYITLCVLFLTFAGEGGGRNGS